MASNLPTKSYQQSGGEKDAWTQTGGGGGGEFDGQRNWGDIKRPTADGIVQGLQAVRKGREEEREEIVRREGDAVVADFQRYCPSIRLEEPWKTRQVIDPLLCWGCCYPDVNKAHYSKGCGTKGTKQMLPKFKAQTWYCSGNWPPSSGVHIWCRWQSWWAQFMNSQFCLTMKQTMNLFWIKFWL